jgi:peptide/nickel transport system substrate-binding protein
MKRSFASILICGILLMSLSGCGRSATSSSTGGAEKAKKTDIVVGIKKDAVSIDPHLNYDTYSSYIIRHVFSRLVKLDNNLKIVSDLAEKWEYLSANELQMTLRKGAVFHDGSPVTSSDVKFSIERQKDSPTVANFVKPITDIRIVDDRTFVLVTKEPFGPLLVNLSHTSSSILPAKIAAERGAEFKTKPVGSGPMVFSEWKSGDQIKLAKNNKYWENVAVSSLTYRVIPEAAARTIALETGEIDLAMELGAIDAPKVEKSSALKLYAVPSNAIEYAGLNLAYKPLSNVLVRKALNYAMNKKAILAVAMEGFGTIANSYMIPTVPGYTDDVATYDYKPEKAKELLAEAGYANGFSLKIKVSGEDRSRIAEMVQADLAQVGVKVTIENLEWATFLEQCNKKDYEMFIMAWTNSLGDPDTSVYNIFLTGGPSNRMGYSNPKVDELLVAGRKETNQTVRVEQYRKALQLIAEDAPWVPFYVKQNLVGAAAGLQDYTQHPMGADLLYMVHY